jgi:two-component system CheB/CheR fusion protein
MKKSEKTHADRPVPSSADATSPDCAEPAGPRVVGIGASAGGLEAFEQFFAGLPPDTGLAFVLVPHLEPTHRGMMPELLARHTKMRVVEAGDGMEVEPNCVYIIPPNADLAILHGKLQVLEPVAPRGLRTPIDLFFRHLAEDQKERAIGIILSGMGSDGTLGVRAIKEQFGMVMVQDPASAKYDGMPRSAINTGIVDYVASAEELPVKLTQYIHHAPPPLKDRELPEAEPPTALQKVFVLLRTRKANDFSCYKTSTVNRRIERRMGVHQFDSLSRYARFLHENPQEVELLYKELLIGVTNFFRDPELFDLLKGFAIPQMLRGREGGRLLRVWNPACSTGEETYSLVIVLMECLARLKLEENPSIQVFATDIDQEAIDKARQGSFPAGIAADVSPERLQRFFVQEDEGYRIKKEVRDLVVFAQQNLLVDPPFTKIDILCCRNLLIYLNTETQKKLLPLMHYALNPGGLLILGSAESTSGFNHLFAPLDTKWKVYQRLEVSERPSIEMPAFAPPRDAQEAAKAKAQGSETDVLLSAQRSLLDLYGPPAVIVNAEGDIIYVNARTGKFLEPASGKAGMNVLAMAREGLREDLEVAIHNAKTRKTAFTLKGVKVKSNGGWTTIDLTVGPLPDRDAPAGLLLVVFQETGVGEPLGSAGTVPTSSDSTTPRNELEEELLRTRERLQSTIEEMQATQEELRSANEELQSSNEELQSTNEELNSSKEELQSLNEEMQTVNAELQSKMDELSRSNSDMKNLLNGTEIATIFLDNDLEVKRFTPQATEIVNMVASDVGRPFGHFTTNLKYDGLVQDVKDVADKLVPKELQIEANDGSWYNLRILPYRTLDNVIDGVVMTFSDITELKRLEASFREQHAEAGTCLDCAENIIATIREPVVILDAELRIVAASRSFCQTFQVASAIIEGRPHYESARQQWEVPGLRQLVDNVLSKNAQFLDVRVEHDFPNIGHKVLLLNARRMIGANRHLPLVLLAIEDITQPR